jgi:hypothetical protein
VEGFAGIPRGQIGVVSKSARLGHACVPTADNRDLARDRSNGVQLTAHTLEPALCRLSGLAAGAGTSADGSPIQVEARDDVLFAMPQVIAIADVSTIHPTSLNTLFRAAATAGAAASHRDRQKQTAYARVEPNGYSFVPFSVESYGRLGQPAMTLLHS